MFSQDLLTEAEQLLSQCRASGLTIVTAESCTGGLIAGLLTEIAGSSDVFDRGFVTYSNAAKMAHLAVRDAVLSAHGAVSRETVLAMAHGALEASGAAIAIAVSGVAGPGGGTLDKPVGLVHLACQRRGRTPVHLEQRYGDIGRSDVRLATVSDAVAMMRDAAR